MAKTHRALKQGILARELSGALAGRGGVGTAGNGSPTTVPSYHTLINLPLLHHRYAGNGSDATLTRASEATVVDHEGIVRLCQNDEFRFTGARRGENLVYAYGASGTDLTVGWVAAGLSNIVDSETVDFDGTNYSRIQISTSVLANTTYLVRYDAWVDSGTHDLRFNTSAGTSGLPNNTVTTTRKTFTSKVTTTGVGTYLAIQNGLAAEAGEVHITNIQIEINQDLPSEFIAPNDSACSERDIAVRYFPYENGNSVDANGVVTEDRGADIDPALMKRLLVEEAATNVMEWSDDIESNTWAKHNVVVTNDFIEETNVISDFNINQYHVFEAEAYTFSCVAKANGRNHLRITLSGGPFGGVAASYNLSTGIVEATGTSTDIATIEDRGDGWYYCVCTHTATAGGGGTAWRPSDSANGHTYQGVEGLGIRVKNINATKTAYPLSHIPTESIAATRLADDCQTVWPTGLVNDFVVSCEGLFTEIPNSNYLVNAYDGATTDNEAKMVINASSRLFVARKRINSVNIDTTQDTVSRHDTHSFKIRLSSTTGVTGYLDNVNQGVNSTNLEDYPPLSDMAIGRRVNTNWLNGNIGDISVVSGDLTDEEVYLLDNDDPWAGMTLDFQALNGAADVQKGIGGLTTVRASDAYLWNPRTGVYDLYGSNEPLWNSYGELQYYPAATNSILYSNDLTNIVNWIAGGSNTRLLDEVGLTGALNTASTIGDIDAAVSASIVQDITAAQVATETNTIKVWIKKTATAQWPSINHKNESGVSRTYIGFNTLTGHFWHRPIDSVGTSTTEVIDLGEWWIVCNELLLTETGGTYGKVEIFPSAYIEDNGSQSGALTGEVIIGNVEHHADKTIAEVRDLPPIPTDGAAVTMNATEYSFDIANHDNDDGVWVCDTRPSIGVGDYPFYEGILSVYVNYTSLFYHHTSILGITNHDGTSGIHASPVSFSAGDLLQPSVVYHAGESLRAISLLDKQTEGVYDGTYATTTKITLFNAANYPATMRNLRRYHITSFIQGKSYVSKGFPVL